MPGYVIEEESVNAWDIKYYSLPNIASLQFCSYNDWVSLCCAALKTTPFSFYFTVMHCFMLICHITPHKDMVEEVKKIKTE